MTIIDLNADIGEAEGLEGRRSEADILHYISSANIACGGHAGTDETLHATVKGAIENSVTIGAHPSYPDRENFGRKSMILGRDIDRDDLQRSLLAQIRKLRDIASSLGANMAYVKPHGALYNDAVNSPAHADLIASVIKDIDAHLCFMGAPNSEMGRAARDHGLTFVAEGFIDRRYSDDGHLQSRAVDGAVIKSQPERMQQALSLALHNTVTTATGNTLTVKADSLCVHGDSAGAVETAHQARQALEAAGITIKAFA